MSAEKIWNHLKQGGLNDYGCAGLMGNLYAESLLQPNNMENYYEARLGYNDVTYTQAVDNGVYDNFVKDCVGYGIAQWTYWTRKQALLAFAKARGVSIGDLAMQLDFLIKELKSDYPGVYRILQTATSVAQASNIVLLEFERPADQSYKVQQQRTEFGNTYYDRFAQKTAAPQVVVDNPVEKVLSIARAEIGYIEKASNANLDDKTANAGSNNWTKYARDLADVGFYNFNKNGYAWCDVFADWVYVKAFGVALALSITGQERGGLGAACKFSAQYYRNMGRFYTSDPQPGDQIFFYYSGDINHTGIVEKVANGYVYTIEGNTSGFKDIPNDGTVNSQCYALNNSVIAGYGRPNWDLIPKTEKPVVAPTPEPVVQPAPIPEQPEPQQPVKGDEQMTSEDFKKQMALYRAELQDNDASGWSAEAREWAMSTGLVAGGSAASFNGMWQDFLTREQMVTILHRFAKMMGKA